MDLIKPNVDKWRLNDWLAHCPLVAILRGIRPDEAEAIVSVIEQAGIVIVEVPLNSPDPLISIARLQARFGDRMLIGAGTVMTAKGVEAVRDAGGRLIVSPHAATDVVRAAKSHGLFACPGFATPTEAFACLDAGADALKLFPAEASSPTILRAMRAVLPPGTLVLPVGGIGADNMAPWRAAGAAGFGIGSQLYAPGDTPETVAVKVRLLMAGVTG
jgi:2-dehydro-3-deoxyphosphogalactonate aldolase